MQYVNVIALQVEPKRRSRLILIVNHEYVIGPYHWHNLRSQPLRAKYRRKRIQPLVRCHQERKRACGKGNVAVMRHVIAAQPPRRARAQ